MKTPRSIALAAVACGLAWPAMAQDAVQEMRPYISGMFSHVFEQNDRDALVGGGSEALDEGNGFQLGFGMPVSRRFGVELSAFGHRFDHGSAGGPSLSDRGIKVEGLYFYSRNPEFSPYFAVGTGAIRTKVSGDSSTDGFADVGLGFMKYFNVAGKDFALRGDLRYRHIFLEDRVFGQNDIDDLGEGVLQIGLVVPLGERAVAAAEPAAPPVPAAGPCPDADGDGVCDAVDECPDTPAGTAVNEKGCPAEAAPAKAAGVDPNQRFEDVHFAFDQSRLTDYAKALLDNAARVITDLSKDHPELQVEIFGHTDSVGTDGYNVGLGERRANVVREYLLRKGVDGARMSTQSYGESRPKATNDTHEGRALNRRAEVRTRGK